MQSLEQRIEEDGPLGARDAVRLVSRVCRTIDALHSAGATHGRLGPAAIALPGPMLSQARLLPASRCDEDRAFHAPERQSGGGASHGDDAYALAALLYWLLTAHKREVPDEQGQSQRPPPLAVFDAGDDTLEGVLECALSAEPAARPADVRALRQDLDSWLEKEGAAFEEPLPWLEGSLPDQPQVDFASLPPPPKAEPSQARARLGDAPNPDLFVVLDEESTLKQLDQPGESVATKNKKGAPDSGSRRPPKLVPPKAAGKRSLPPPLPGSEAEKAEKTKKKGDSAAAGSEPTSTPSPVARPRSLFSSALVVLAVGGLLVLGGRALGLWGRPVAPVAEPTPAAAVSSTITPPTSIPQVASGLVGSSSAPSASAVSGSSSAQEPSAAPVAASASVAGPASRFAPYATPSACLAAMFPDDTFEGAAELDFVCEENKPLGGAPRIREAIVLAGNGRAVTGGMKEWALLGFYELGALAILQGRCCPELPTYDMPPSLGNCSNLVKPLSDLRAVSHPSVAKAKADKAVAAFEDGIRCLSRSRQGKLFGGYPRPSGGEGTALGKTLSRALAK